MDNQYQNNNNMENSYNSENESSISGSVNTKKSSPSSFHEKQYPNQSYQQFQQNYRSNSYSDPYHSQQPVQTGSFSRNYTDQINYGGGNIGVNYSGVQSASKTQYNLYNDSRRYPSQQVISQNPTGYSNNRQIMNDIAAGSRQSSSGYSYNGSYNNYNSQTYPQPAVLQQKQKNKNFSLALICISSLAAVAAISAVIFIAVSGIGEDIVENESSSSSESSEEIINSPQIVLPEAPQVSADENGPQISVGEDKDELSESAKITNTAYNKIYPSIVCITSYKAGTDYALTASGEGSGIIITSDGYIATNSHVVENSTDTGVMITLSDGKQYLGTVIGVDTKTDLAVVKISADGLTAADLCNSDSLEVGQDAFAIGNPGGSSFSNSLTKGTVSALNRVLNSNGYVKFIQTDAAINPGNSGGALVNEHGQVIGMNTAKLVDEEFEGMGFAIPSNTVVEIINKLIKYGYINDRGTLGIEGETCNLYMARAYNVPEGMMITKITNKSPLKSTNASSNDIITAINGYKIKNAVEFIDKLKEYKPGDKVTLTLFRDKKKGSQGVGYFDVEVVLIEDR